MNFVPFDSIITIDYLSNKIIRALALFRSNLNPPLLFDSYTMKYI